MKKGAIIGAVLTPLVLLPFESPALEPAPETLRISRAADTFGRDISGDGQLVAVTDSASRPLVVSVTEADGAPAKGVSVRFSVLAEPEDNLRTGNRASVSPQRVLTDEHGYAKSWVKIGGRPGDYHLAASVDGQECHVRFMIQGMQKGWPILMVLGLVGGLSLFLFGLNFIARALNRIAGGRLRHMTFSMSERRHVGVLVGALLTVLVQSSSATVAMLMSFANTGLVSFSQSLGLILGADIGTTLTIQVIAFKVTRLAPVIVAAGFLLMSLRHPYAYTGRAVFGIGLVFLGLRLMSDAISPLETSPTFEGILTALSARPVVTAVLAAIFAAAVRSSAGPIGLAITLGYGGMVDMNTAIAVVLGANLGSALTALLAAFGSTAEGKRVAVAHSVFKFVVVILFFAFFSQFAAVLSVVGGSTARQIANAHTVLNLAAVLLFFPFLGPYERLIKAVIREGPKTMERRPRYLDETVLDTPSLAIGQAQREVLRMADTVVGMFSRVMDVLRKNDDALRKEVVSEDDKVDELAEKTTTYLTRISQEELSTEQSLKGVALLHIVDELESIGDVVSKSLMTYARKKIESGFYFSKEGFSEMSQFHDYVCGTLKMAVTSLSTWDTHLARDTVARRGEGERKRTMLHDAHIDRLRKDKKESLDTSSVHLDLIRDLERVNLHAVNSAGAVLGKMSYDATEVSKSKGKRA